MGEYFEMENGRCKVTDKFKEEIRKAMAESQTISLSALERMRTSSFENACKKTWNFAKNTIRKGMELQVKVIKTLKKAITR